MITRCNFIFKICIICSLPYCDIKYLTLLGSKIVEYHGTSSAIDNFCFGSFFTCNYGKCSHFSSPSSKGTMFLWRCKTKWWNRAWFSGIFYTMMYHCIASQYSLSDEWCPCVHFFCTWFPNTELCLKHAYIYHRDSWAYELVFTS